jgi:hypothetical protein
MTDWHQHVEKAKLPLRHTSITLVPNYLLA